MFRLLVIKCVLNSLKHGLNEESQDYMCKSHDNIIRVTTIYQNHVKTKPVDTFQMSNYAHIIDNS